ncbi:leucine-rich repeat domain-containing protein [uncultured Microscilla sp.]|uniref:leucine-rich repeat domain-containing protein n=1 Tax=uncultured Microscilla sp. TaxID=432653 RepID=UPI0026364B70|nr:leucine-rich repeat domain-containing protein [uncultured Microscilla sp.]
MKKTIIALVVACWIPAIAQAQALLNNTKVYTSFEEAFKTPKTVYILDVSKKKLSKLPHNIDQLVNLQKLLLGENKLKKLPDSFIKLNKLEHLELQKNKLKKLPQGFENLRQLKYLDLANNRFRQIPMSIFKINTLETLHFFGNRVKTISPEIGQLTQLKSLRLGSNRIRKLPNNLGQLSHLKELHLPDNCLRKLPPSFNQLDSLYWLDLNHNWFRKLPQELKGLDNLHIAFFWDRGFSKKNKRDVETAQPNTEFKYDPKYAGKYWGVYAGFQQGSQSVIEAGVVKGFKKDFITYHYGIGGEFNLNGKMQGVKFGGWVNALIALGMQATFYLDDGQKAAAIRPEIGIGANLFSLMYGYNIIIGDNLQHTNRHMVSLRMVLPLAPMFFP